MDQGGFLEIGLLFGAADFMLAEAGGGKTLLLFETILIFVAGSGHIITRDSLPLVLVRVLALTLVEVLVRTPLIKGHME